MGGRIVGFGLADEVVTVWLATAFEGGRHQRRIDQIAAIERDSLTTLIRES
jgi:ribose 5-phosphate isomerase B